MLITLSGLPGSGTSTVAHRIADELDLEHLNGGMIFRSLAREAGLSLAEFAVRAESDDSIDRALDARLTERARAGGVVLESRLAGWLAHRAQLDGLLVWVHCDEGERAVRVAARDGGDPDEIVEVNRIREASEAQRYRSFYDIDIDDRSIYGLIVDSTRRSPEQIVDDILTAVGKASTTDA